MANPSIGGVEVVAFAFPIEGQKALNRSISAAWDNSRKGIEYGSPDSIISIHLRLIDATVKDNIYAALIAATNFIVAIVPPSTLNYGNGAGVSVNAQWIDDSWHEWKDTSASNTWNVDLNFIYIS